MKAQLDRFEPVTGVAMHQQVAEFVRNLIRSGALAADTRLPTVRELAERWQTSHFTVQTGLAPLVDEGLLARRPRLGTFVRQPAATLTCVGVYVAGSFWRAPWARFTQTVCSQLDQALQARGLDTRVFVDTRPESRQKSAIFPELLQAIEQRQVQAVVAPVVEMERLAWLTKLPVPVTAVSGAESAHGVDFDAAQFVTDGLTVLRDRGCRSVGMISVLKPDAPAAAAGDAHSQVFHVNNCARRLGLECRPEWLKTPPPSAYVATMDAERFGHDSFVALWEQAEHPDGLLIFTDLAARGALLAMASRHVRVPQELKLALHRNREIGLLCPVPATFLDVSVEEVTAALIAQIERQHRGEPAPTAMLRYHITQESRDERIAQAN